MSKKGSQLPKDLDSRKKFSDGIRIKHSVLTPSNPARASAGFSTGGSKRENSTKYNPQ